MQVHPADSGAGAEGEPDAMGLESAGPAKPRADWPAAIPRKHLVLRVHMGALGLRLTCLPAEPLTQGPSCTHPSLQKYDYDSSSVRKRFFREALLQITIPFLLKKLAPTCKSVSPRLAVAPQGVAICTASDPSLPALPAGAATLPGADL